MNRFFGFFVLAIFVFLPFSAKSEAFGAVFSGGGGKGAYQVGVWRALCERGVAQKITAISGSSVGALNAALFACVPIETAEKLWTDEVPRNLTKDDALISQNGLLTVIEKIDVSKIRLIESPAIFVTTVRSRLPIFKLFTATPGFYAHRFLLNLEDDDEIKKLLLATSAFPILTDPVKLSDGHLHSDGGNEKMGGDNVPIYPIEEACPEVKKVVIVYLEQKPERRIRAIDHESLELLEIIPTIDLGGLLDGTANFSKERIELLIRQGYEDACAVLDKKKIRPVSSWWFE